MTSEFIIANKLKENDILECIFQIILKVSKESINTTNSDCDNKQEVKEFDNHEWSYSESNENS